MAKAKRIPTKKTKETEVKQPEVQEQETEKTENVQPEVQEEPKTETQENNTETKDNKKLESFDPNSEAYIKENLKKVKSLPDAYELFKNTDVIKDLVIGLKQYYDFITGPKKDQPLEYVAANYRLYNLVINQLGDEKYSKVKTRLNVLLKVFNVEKNGAFNIINILKYDHYWKYGQKTRISYYLLMTFLEGISDPKTRRDELKRLSLEKLAKYVPVKVTENLRRYLNI